MGTRLVLLINFLYWNGERYFVDASRAHGIVRKRLPIFSGDFGCSRTLPIAAAVVEQRVLRQAPTEGTRLIGSVQPPPKDSVYRSWFEAPPVPPQYWPGAKIQLKGPNVSRVINTDQTGIYQVDGLPEGEYELTLHAPGNQFVGFGGVGSPPAKVKLRNGQPFGHNFQTYWNGRIEGRVTDETGNPAARVLVSLHREDRGRLLANAETVVHTEPDGSYRLQKIPPGRYELIVNNDGPDRERPYARRIYPRILTLGEGERLPSIDIVAPRLEGRPVRVSASAPFDPANPELSVCIAYEHAADFDKLRGAFCPVRTVAGGEVSVHLFGRSRVRLFALAYTPHLEYRSQTIEAPADRMPAKVELVLKPSPGTR